MLIDDRTPRLNLPLPHPDNGLEDDVARMREFFNAIDTKMVLAEEVSKIATVYKPAQAPQMRLLSELFQWAPNIGTANGTLRILLPVLPDDNDDYSIVQFVVRVTEQGTGTSYIYIDGRITVNSAAGRQWTSCRTFIDNKGKVNLGFVSRVRLVLEQGRHVILLSKAANPVQSIWYSPIVTLESGQILNSADSNFSALEVGTNYSANLLTVEDMDQEVHHDFTALIPIYESDASVFMRGLLQLVDQAAGKSYLGVAAVQGTNFKGNADTATNATQAANATEAAQAVKLKTPRKINGVNFDGTTDVTIADNTKLPTAGGTVNGSVVVTGNLTVQGTTTTVDSTSVSTSEAIISVAKDNATAAVPYGGFRMERGATDAFWVFNEATDRWTAFLSSDNLATAGSLADIQAANIYGALRGNADSATFATGAEVANYAVALQTPRTINGVSFNGTANITIADATKLPLAGGTITGAVIFTAQPTIQWTTPQIQFYDTDWGPRWLHCNSGLIGFLTSAGGWAMYVDNGGNLVATGNVTAYSDERLKEEIDIITGAVEKVKQLRGVNYTRKDTRKRQSGLIAQEVQKVLPEVVDLQGDYLTVAYGNMMGLMVEAIKELTARIEVLEGKK